MRKEFSTVPRRARLGAGPLAAGLRRAARLSRSTSRCAAPDWDTLAAQAAKLKRRAAEERPRDRRRHRLPGRLARAADHARPRARLRRSASHVQDVANTVSALVGGSHGRASTRRPGAASTSACASSRRSARAPRTSPTLRVRTPTGGPRAALAGDDAAGEGRCCRRSTTPTASARSRISGNVAPGHSQTRGDGLRRRRCGKDCPPATASS